MKKQQIKSAISAVVLGVASPLAMVLPASAAEMFWDGGSYSSYSDSFNTPANWAGGVVPGAGDNAVFTTDSKYSYTEATVRNIDNDVSALTLARLVFDGDVELSSTSFTIEGNAITLTDSISAQMTGTAGDHQVLTDVNLGDDVTFKTTGSNTLQVGDDDTTLNLGANDLTLQADGGTISIVGEIDGSGKLVKKGSGKVSNLATPADGYTGSTEVTEGTYVVTETSQDNIVINGGTLMGQSDLLGTVTMSAGSIAPGNSPGCLGTSDLTLTGGTFDVEIAGTTICTGYDQITVEGSVNLGSDTTLDVDFGSFEPEVNTSFALILNDGEDAVEGTFKDFADGQSRTLGDYTYQINYNGGDGNDVILLVTGTPSAPDTGIGSIISNPAFTLLAAVAALSVIGGLKYADNKRK